MYHIFEKLMYFIFYIWMLIELKKDVVPWIKEKHSHIVKQSTIWYNNNSGQYNETKER